MASDLLGRTNRAFPRAWHSLVLPSDAPEEQAAGALANAIVRAGSVIDITSAPALWGGLMRGTEALLMIRGGSEIENAPSEKIACDLIQAHLVQILSAIGREWIDFYFLQIRDDLPDHQIDGALRALENAKQEGHVRHLGIECLGVADRVLRLWGRRDAFEVALLHAEDSDLIGHANVRRVGIVATYPGTFTTLTPISDSLAIGAPA